MLQQGIPKWPLVYYGGISVKYGLSKRKHYSQVLQKQKNHLARLTAHVPDQTPFQTVHWVFLQAQWKGGMSCFPACVPYTGTENVSRSEKVSVLYAFSRALRNLCSIAWIPTFFSLIRTNDKKNSWNRN